MEERQKKQAEPVQGKKETLTDRQAANTLWEIMKYSGHYRPKYEKYLRFISQFQQIEQLYACMLADVPGVKIGGILEDTGMGEAEKAGALEALWKQGKRKPVMPTEEQDRELKSLKEYIQRLEIQVTRMQTDVSRIATENARTGGRDDAVDLQEEKPPEEKPKPRRAKTAASPFKGAAGNGPGRAQMEKLENEVKGLAEALEGQKEKISRMEEDGAQVRGIILAPQKERGFFSRRRIRKRLEDEQEHISSLLSAGYQADQLDFLLSCREEGIPWEMIKLFSGKELPAALMKKLKDYYLKKKEWGVPDSGTREGAQDGQ